MIPDGYRVRRPKHDLVDQLLGTGRGGDGGFKSRAEALTFAAGFGWARQRRESFSEVEEPIRFEVYRGIGKGWEAEAFINAVALLSYGNDPLVLGKERLLDRITAFEEYAYGGILELQREINNTPNLTVMEILLELTRKAAHGQSDEGELPPELERLLGPGTW